MEGNLFEPSIFTSRPIRFANLFSHVLARRGVREHVDERSTEDTRCLTDGEGLLWAVRGDHELLDEFVHDEEPTGSVVNIELAIEEAFEVDLWPASMAHILNDAHQRWDTMLMRSAEERSSKLCAYILAYLWEEQKLIGPRLRLDLACEIHLTGGTRRPRSLDDVAHLVRQVTAGDAPLSGKIPWSPPRWEPPSKVAGLATLTWIQHQIVRDEFSIAWLDQNSEARAALPVWGRRVDERFKQGHAERLALIKCAKR